jgi:hypothetical protein
MNEEESTNSDGSMDDNPLNSDGGVTSIDDLLAASSAASTEYANDATNVLMLIIK